MIQKHTLKRDELLKERNEHAGAPFVRLWKIKILEVQNEALGILGAIHAAGVGADKQARLAQLLQHVL